MVRSKNDGSLTTNMPSVYLQAIQNEAMQMNVTASQRARDIIVDYYNKEYLQAKNKVEVLKMIESDELYKLFESQQIPKGYIHD